VGYRITAVYLDGTTALYPEQVSINNTAPAGQNKFGKEASVFETNVLAVQNAESENDFRAPQTGDAEFFINRASNEESFGFFTRERISGVSTLNPGLTAIQSFICANGRALRIETAESGMFKIPAAAITAANFNPNNPLRIFSDGREEALRLESDGSIVFLARGLDTVYTNRRVYFLTDAVDGAKSTPMRILPVPVTSRRKKQLISPQAAGPQTGETVQTNALQRQQSVFETNTVYLAAAPNGTNVDKFFSLKTFAQPASFQINSPGVVAAPTDDQPCLSKN
jgi:hypothetical protein